MVKLFIYEDPKKKQNIIGSYYMEILDDEIVYKSKRMHGKDVKLTEEEKNSCDFLI